MQLDDFLNKLHTTYTPGKSSASSMQEKLKLLRLAKAIEALQPYQGISKWFVVGSPYDINFLPKHKAFFDATRTYREVMFCLSNRSGKTVAGAYATACHATGKYPSWWTGKRFDGPVDIWAVGKTAETTRDVVQKELLGDMGRMGTGMIPKEDILATRSRQGVPNAISLCSVRHVSGGISNIGFKSYDQKMDAFFGTAKHVVWCDEEPPLDIYNECVIRTMTTNGIVYTTATPLAGLTPFIKSFEETADFLANSVPTVRRNFETEDRTTMPSRAFIRGSWAHAPWLTEEAKRELLASTPEHLRLARSEGLPAAGEQNVYPFSFDDISCDPFEIPRHYSRFYGMDVGSNTAAVFFCMDPNTKNVFVYDEYLEKDKPPLIHAHAIKSRGEWLIGAIDPASNQTASTDQNKLLDMYRALGLNLRKADNSVQSGIQTIWQMLSDGRLKVFKHCRMIESELYMYKVDENGKVIKKNDHLMDALRYGIMTGMKSAKFAPSSNRGVSSGSTQRYDI